MPQAAWHDSRYWLAAGWTMFQFLGIGILLWIFGGFLRRGLRRAQPHIRYAVALGLLLATAAIPAGLFVSALDSAGELSAQGDLRTTGLSLTVNVKSQTRPMPTQANRVRAEVPQIPDTPSVSPVPLPTSIDWKSLLASGLDSVRNPACRWLPWLWLVGSPIILLVLACGVNGADRLRRAGRVLHEGDVVVANARLRAALRVGRQVAVVACDRVAAPILVGILRPAILLPPAVLAGCSPEQMEMILLHELAHVRRWDNLVNVVQRVIEAVLFFHPVVWWLSSWVRLEREECCDCIVVAHTGRPQAYAETLAFLALPGITPRLAAATMADCHLATRIRHILNLEDEVMNVSRKAFVATAGLLIFAGCFAASVAQTNDAAADKAIEPPAVDSVNDGGAQVPTSGTTTNSEALLHVIDASVVKEILAFQNYGQNPAAVGLDDLAVPILHGTGTPLSATQLGIRYLVAQQASGALQQSASQRKWGPEQATGAPDSPDYPNNQGTAWCPATADGQEEWLELTYGEPVEPLVLVVYECLKPGALTRVVAFDAEANELNAWTGKDPSPPDGGNGSAISVVPLKLKKIKIVRLRLYFDSARVEGWNEIDAAGILDVKGGIRWATTATASSTWVDQSTAAVLSTVPLSDAMWLGSIDNLGDEAFGRVAAGSARTSPWKSSNFRLSVVADPMGWELLSAAQHPGNAAGGGASDSVTVFEERIKKLEADLAGLREALQQLKAPGSEKSNVP